MNNNPDSNDNLFNPSQLNGTSNMNSNVNQPVNQQQSVQQPMYSSPIPNMQPDYTNVNTMNSNKKKPQNMILIIIAIAVVAIILVGILIFNKMNSANRGNGGTSLEESLTSSNSFFLRNSDGLYALFDINGKQLTDFEFKNTHDFVNGAAHVTTKDGKSGIISPNGKMIVNYDACKYLYSSDGPLYQCVDKEYNNHIMNSSGKVILTGKNLDLLSFIGENKYAIVKDEEAEKYIVYDYDGNKLTSFATVDDMEIENANVNSLENYVSIFYNNTNYIFDINKSKLLLTLSENNPLCIEKVNNNHPDEFILKTCSNWYDNIDEYEHKLVRNGKVVYTKTSDKLGKLSFEGDNVIFSDDAKYLLDNQGNKTIKLGYTAYKDYKNYIKQLSGVSNGSELYVDGQLKETISCDSIMGSYAEFGVYLLEHCRGFGDGDKIYIKYDGTRINDKSYKKASDFDKNGYAVVGTYNVHLINLKGETVSDDYNEKIYAVDGTDNLYQGINDKTESIFEVNGDKIITGNKIHTQVSNGVVYAIVENDQDYTIYDLKKKKNIVTVDVEPHTLSKYFTISKNSKTQYYSYTTGKMFYEE